MAAARHARYDTIGRGYRSHRRPDPRIRAAIEAHLPPGGSVLNVGAGTGSYEPMDRRVLAVEPSALMIAQRPDGAAPAVQARAEALPLRDRSFDAGLALLTLHHWDDWRLGLAEMRRVVRGPVVLFTWVGLPQPFWLNDYFPDLDWDRARFPSVDAMSEVLGDLLVETVSVPAECEDGFLCAWWARPEAYLDAQVRANISSFAGVDATDGVEALRRDLADGRWHQRHGHLLQRDAVDFGYRLVVASGA